MIFALILRLLILLICVGGAFIIFNKFIHPFFFQEDLEETLEDAVEEKTILNVLNEATNNSSPVVTIEANK